MQGELTCEYATLLAATAVGATRLAAVKLTRVSDLTGLSKDKIADLTRNGFKEINLRNKKSWTAGTKEFFDHKTEVLKRKFYEFPRVIESKLKFE